MSKRPDISDRTCSNCRDEVITDPRRTATLGPKCTESIKVNPAPVEDTLTLDDLFARVARNHAAEQSRLRVDIDGYGSR